MPTYHIHIEGQVQGVGFRPYVYRMAREHGLKGWVSNT
ncbi:MAG: acylphosphatase, partial [Phaeodactylibacter sp.]|nr:acylphosphatase [Phaeodactylibacter sp.]